MPSTLLSTGALLEARLWACMLCAEAPDCPRAQHPGNADADAGGRKKHLCSVLTQLLQGRSQGPCAVHVDMLIGGKRCTSKSTVTLPVLLREMLWLSLMAKEPWYSTTGCRGWGKMIKSGTIVSSVCSRRLGVPNDSKAPCTAPDTAVRMMYSCTCAPAKLIHSPPSCSRPQALQPSI